METDFQFLKPVKDNRSEVKDIKQFNKDHITSKHPKYLEKLSQLRVKNYKFKYNPKTDVQPNFIPGKTYK